MYRVFEVGEHFGEYGYAGNCYRWRYGAPDHRFGFQDSFVFANLFYVLDKVYHIQGFAMRGTVAGKAIAGVGFVVHLLARRLVRMKGTVEPQVLIGLEVVVLQYFG